MGALMGALMADQESEAAPLRADRLYRFYRAGDEETLALQGVSLTLHAGQVLAVTGPSGSGKSTLLRCLSGVDEPSGGTVWVGTERMSHRPEAARAKLRARGVGIVVQRDNLFAHLTVLANIRIAQKLGGGTPAWAVDVLARLGLEHRADALPGQLSGGEAARAGLAVALANQPRVLLADEPTGDLDASTEERVLDLIVDYAATGGSVLVASHSDGVRRRADHVIALSDGAVA